MKIRYRILDTKHVIRVCYLRWARRYNSAATQRDLPGQVKPAES